MKLGHLSMAAAVSWALLLGAVPGRADLGRLTADEAVRLALRDNTTVYQAAKAVEQAHGNFRLTRSAVMPQLNAEGDIQHAHSGVSSSNIVTSEIPATNTDARSASLTVSQSLINLESWNSVSQAGHNLDASKAGELDTRLAVALAVRQQFYALVRAKRLAGVDAEAARLDSSQMALTQGLFDVGSAPKTDLLKARTQQAQSRLNLITARHNVDIERLRLASLLGMSEDRGLDVDEALPEDVALPDSSSLLQTAYSSRPDLKQIDMRIQAAEAGLGAARASRYPTLGASANLRKDITIIDQAPSPQPYVTGYHIDSFDLTDSSFAFTPTLGTTMIGYHSESRPVSWSVGARLSLPIFDGLNAKGRIEAQSAELDIQRRDLTQKKVDVALEVRQAWLGLQEAREREGVAREALESAEESYTLNQEKYRLGSSTLLELTTAEVQLVTSRSDMVDAGVGLQLSKALLNRALGANP